MCIVSNFASTHCLNKTKHSMEYGHSHIIEISILGHCICNNVFSRKRSNHRIYVGTLNQSIIKKDVAINIDILSLAITIYSISRPTNVLNCVLDLPLLRVVTWDLYNQLLIHFEPYICTLLLLMVHAI